MNIFYSLSEGRGRLTETNLSAFAAFLLAPHMPHGLSDTFLRAFLTEVASGCGEPGRFTEVLSRPLLAAEVALEKRYDGRISRTVDIELQIMAGNGSGQHKIHHLIIENKVKAATAQTAQLAEQFASVVEADCDAPITVVFVTPPGDASALRAGFDALELDAHPLHRKALLRWTGEELGQRPVVELIREPLRREAAAEIEPITDNTRHTLKAFVLFLQREIVPEAMARRRFPTQNSMDVLKQRIVELDGQIYVIARYRNNVVKVFDADADQEVDAHPKLRLINERFGLGVQLLHNSGGRVNTQDLGKKVLAKLEQHDIGAPS
jgi:hypothetical protein